MTETDTREQVTQANRAALQLANVEEARRNAALADIAARIGKVAAWRRLQGETPARPAPLYVRAADAAPARDLPPVILDDA